MPNIENIKKYKNIHMIGIGGISMSGIAEILANWGFSVSGSNNVDSEILHTLENAGIKVFVGHDAKNVIGADCVVYTAAIHQDNPELVHAKELGIPTIERSDFLGELTRCYKNTIAISGTHGKTTTTSLVSLCFLEALRDPSIQVGAIIKELDGNYRVGNSENFIIEACEYVESFLKFSPKSAVVLNIDNDHLDYFKNFENIVNAFRKYVAILPFDGLLVANADDKNCFDLRNYTDAKFVTYGIKNDKANFVARNISFDKNGFAKFDVYYNNNFYSEMKLSVPGIHNVSNALACIALCSEYGIQKHIIKSALLSFTGANRRFELVGSYENITIFDDYAHHPSEILATAKALKNKTYRQSWIIFQPHTYSRTKSLLDDFAKVLTNFDNIIVTDIYAARESNNYDISSIDLVNKIKSLGKDATYISSFDDIVKYVRERACPNDIILTVGAGTVTEIGRKILLK